MPLWRDILRLSVELVEPGETQAIDTPGWIVSQQPRITPKRTNYTFKAVNTTVLIDWKLVRS